MVGVISIWSRTPAGFKLTKFFGIENFSIAKDSGKVLIIVIYIVFIIINHGPQCDWCDSLNP